MSEQAAQEPTMEEILASIRRIISEDDAPAAEGHPAAEAAPTPEPAPAPPVEESPALMDETPSMQAEDVLELTDKVEEPAPVETIGDIDIAPRPAPTPEPAVSLQSEEPAPFIAPTPQYQMGSASMAGGTTIEDLVRSILEPKIREWADQNLESIMRDIVREKLDRVFK
jgi:cell pole-organizing protein PopZ